MDELKDNLFFGTRPVIEAVEAGKEIDKIFIQHGMNNALINELKELLRKRDIIYQVVPIEKLDRLTRKNHQSVVCFISNITYYKTEHPHWVYH